MIEIKGDMLGSLSGAYGGDTLNTAVYLSRLAAPGLARVSYATRLGQDEFSSHMLASWAEEGIDTRLVTRDPLQLPGLYSIQVDPRGERTFYYWRDSSAARDYFADPDNPLEGALDSLDGLYFSGISLAILAPEGRQYLLGLARVMKQRGKAVIFDSNFRLRLWKEAARAEPWYRKAYEGATTALVSLDDHQVLWGLGEEEARKRTLGLPCPEVVVKRGGASTLYRGAVGELQEVPLEAIARPVDTTGAGDSFAGAWLAARLGGAEPREAIEAAHRLAARVIMHPGAIIRREAMADLAV